MLSGDPAHIKYYCQFDGMIEEEPIIEDLKFELEFFQVPESMEEDQT